MLRQTAARALLLGGLTAGGCSQQSDGLIDACREYAQNYYDREAQCFGVTPAPDVPRDIDRFAESCARSAEAPRSEVTARYWSDCAAAVDNGCQAYQCASYPPGDGVTGDPCLASAQCASLWCRGTQMADSDGLIRSQALGCGTCADRLAIGTSCDITVDACEPGATCFLGRCRAQGTVGVECTLKGDCAPPLTCNSGGFCGQVAYQGEPCTTRADCTDFMTCDPTARVCVTALFAPPGAACDAVLTFCQHGLCEQGRCATLIPDGMPCDPDDHSQRCDTAAFCVAGICTIPDPKTCEP